AAVSGRAPPARLPPHPKTPPPALRAVPHPRRRAPRPLPPLSRQQSARNLRFPRHADSPHAAREEESLRKTRQAITRGDCRLSVAYRVIQSPASRPQDGGWKLRNLPVG